MESETLKQQTKGLRITVGIVAALVLSIVFIFQRFNYFHFLFNSAQLQSNLPFIFNKSLRLIVNDLACLCLVWAIFQQKKYLTIASYVFVAEVAIILPLYFWVKLSLEGDSEISSPLLSQVHRLIVNPMLMILLMISFFYQKFKSTHTSD